MDRLEQENLPIEVDSRYGHFVFRQLRIRDFTIIAGRTRKVLVEAGYITSANDASQPTGPVLDKLFAAVRPTDDEGHERTPDGDALAVLVQRFAIELDVTTVTKPTGFVSWEDTSDPDELNRVYGVVQEALRSFRGEVQAPEPVVGG